MLTPEDVSSDPKEKTSSKVFVHPVFEVISSGSEDDVEAIRPFLEGSGGKDRKEERLQDVNLEDENGMTVLMYAAWKGKYNMAKFLIQQVRKKEKINYS